MIASYLLDIRKLLRFSSLYGPRRALLKVVGRTNTRWLDILGASFRSRRRDIAVIGCGQFGFATIGYFLHRRFGRCFRSAFDLDVTKSERMARFYRIPRVAATAADVVSDPHTQYVYIATNHATHSDYAVMALEVGKSVYVEKPVSVTLEQLARLEKARRNSGRPRFAGYNRPFSPAVADLRKRVGRPRGPLSLTCFIAGHVLGPDHWYRDPQEGTRVCGNMGHWLDLAVHILGWRGQLPDSWRIQCLFSDPAATDDNLSVSLASEMGDLITIVLTARHEPFEGIREQISYQQDGVMALIDDFRAMEIHNGARRWREVVSSSLVMLEITDMVRRKDAGRQFRLSQASGRLEHLVNQN